MVCFSLYIVNKAGGLIFKKDFVTTENKNRSISKGGNVFLSLASTFHGHHAIAKQLSPIPPNPEDSGIEILEAETFKLHCFTAPTQTKFFIIADPGQKDLEVILKGIYESYADFVMKDPFYIVEMPISKCESFENQITKIVSKS